LELAAGAEVSSAAARDRQAQAAFHIYRDSVRELARRNLEVVRQTFELGRATVFDVIAEQRRFIDVERAYTTAAREAWEARTELKRTTGETR
jgi:outer membrane protein TolC